MVEGDLRKSYFDSEILQMKKLRKESYDCFQAIEVADNDLEREKLVYDF